MHNNTSNGHIVFKHLMALIGATAINNFLIDMGRKNVMGEFMERT